LRYKDTLMVKSGRVYFADGQQRLTHSDAFFYMHIKTVARERGNEPFPRNVKNYLETREIEDNY